MTRAPRGVEGGVPVSLEWFAVDDEAALAALAPEWARLAATAAEPTLFA